MNNNSIVSYAQNFEDVLLWRALKHVEKGFYIDVGAQHPEIDSVSLAFYEKGWRGIHVEPSPQYACLLRENRPDEMVIQAAVSAQGMSLPYFEIADTGLSTCDANIAEQHRSNGYKVRETSVSSVTLDEVFKLCSEREIHWLKIDVEGYESEVLKSWVSSSNKPWVIVIESTFPNTQIEDYLAWEQMVVDRGYQFVYFDGLNRFYISSEHPELRENFRVGPNYFDKFYLSEKSPYSELMNSKIETLKVEHGAQIAQVQTEIEYQSREFNARRTAFEMEIRRLFQELAKRGSDLEEIWLDRERVIKIMEETMTHKDRLAVELDKILHCRSYRITAPLRAVFGVARIFRDKWVAVLKGNKNSVEIKAAPRAPHRPVDSNQPVKAAPLTPLQPVGSNQSDAEDEKYFSQLFQTELYRRQDEQPKVVNETAG